MGILSDYVPLEPLRSLFQVGFAIHFAAPMMERILDRKRKMLRQFVEDAQREKRADLSPLRGIIEEFVRDRGEPSTLTEQEWLAIFAASLKAEVLQFSRETRRYVWRSFAVAIYSLGVVAIIGYFPHLQVRVWVSIVMVACSLLPVAFFARSIEAAYRSAYARCESDYNRTFTKNNERAPLLSGSRPEPRL